MMTKESSVLVLCWATTYDDAAMRMTRTYSIWQLGNGQSAFELCLIKDVLFFKAMYAINEGIVRVPAFVLKQKLEVTLKTTNRWSVEDLYFAQAILYRLIFIQKALTCIWCAWNILQYTIYHIQKTTTIRFGEYMNCIQNVHSIVYFDVRSWIFECINCKKVVVSLSCVYTQ